MKKVLLTIGLFVAFSGMASAANLGGTVYVDVNGLVCDFCARALEKVFGKKEAVESISVNLDEKIVTINFKEGLKLEHKEITQLITESGYNVREIRYGK